MDGTILNLPSSSVKVVELTEGKDVFVDTYDINNNLVQSFFTPSYKILAEDSDLSVPAATSNGETTSDGILEILYNSINIRHLKSIIFAAFFPDLTPMNYMYLDIRLWAYLKIGNFNFQEQMEPSILDHFNKPISFSTGGAFLYTIPMENYSNISHYVGIADELELRVEIHNVNTGNSFSCSTKILGCYEPIPEVKIFTVESQQGSGGGGG